MYQCMFLRFILGNINFNQQLLTIQFLKSISIVGQYLINKYWPEHTCIYVYDKV